MPDFEPAKMEVKTKDGRAVYNYYKIVELLMERDGMTEEEAIDYIDYNTLRALPYMGTGAPIISYKLLND